MAPLEFVLVYPTFLALLCCSMWIAIFFLRKAEVAIAVRYDVDSQRQLGATVPGAEPFEFSGENDGRLRSSLAGSVQFSSFMPTGRVSSRYSVVEGTWDHRQVPMDVAPDYALAAQLGATGPIANIAGKLQDLLSLMQDIGNSLTSMDRLLGLGTSDFFSEFASAVGDIELPDLDSDLLDGAQGANFDQNLGNGLASLKNQIGPVAEIADIYRRLVGESAGARQQAAAKTQEAKQSAQQLESNTKGADEAFESSQGAVEGLNRVLDDPASTPEQKQAAIDEARAQLRSAFDAAAAQLAQGSAKDKDGSDTLIKSSFREKVEGRIPERLEPLSDFADAVKQDGLAGLSRTSESLLDQLSTAIKDMDAAKEKELRESLAFVTEATRTVLADAASTAENMKSRVDEASERNARLGENMPNID